MNIKLSQLKEFTKGLNLKNIPFAFERYELFVVIGGTLAVVVLAGFLFYTKAYQIVATPPEVSIETPEINQALFEQALQDLKVKKQPVSGEPIIDPFR